MEAIQVEIGLESIPYVKSENVKEENLIDSIRQMRRDMEHTDQFLVLPYAYATIPTCHRAATAFSSMRNRLPMAS